MAASNESNDNKSSQRSQTLTLQTELDKTWKPLILRLSELKKDNENSIEQHESNLRSKMRELGELINDQLDELQKEIKAHKPKDKKGVDNSAEKKGYQRLLMVAIRTVDDMKEVLTTISYRHRLFIYQMMHALTNDGDKKAVRDDLEKDINYQLQRWDAYLERIHEFLEFE